MSEDIAQENGLDEKNHYQVLITGIYWDKKTIGQRYVKYDKYDELPSQFTLDLSESVLKQANKKPEEFNDVVETFCYNFLTKKFGHEVNNCQIWLPLEDDVK